MPKLHLGKNYELPKEAKLQLKVDEIIDDIDVLKTKLEDLKASI